MGPFIWIRIKLSQETDGCITAKGKFNSSALFVRADTRRKGRKQWTDSSPLSHCCAQMASWAEGVVLRRLLLFHCCSCSGLLFGNSGFRCRGFFFYVSLHALGHKHHSLKENSWAPLDAAALFLVARPECLVLCSTEPVRSLVSEPIAVSPLACNCSGIKDATAILKYTQ